MADGLDKLKKWLLDKMSSSEVPEIPIYKGEPPEGLPDLSTADLERVARQTRQLLPEEKAELQKRFGRALNPDVVRLGYDLGASGTNLGGWVDPRLKTTLFVPPDVGLNRLKSDPLPHEATHIWQNLARDSFTRPYGRGYSYKAGAPFPDYGIEQQASMMQDSEPSAVDFIRSHPVSDLPRGDVAFIDSLRERLNGKSFDPDSEARLGSIGGVTAVGRRKGNLFSKEPFESTK